MAVTIHNDRTQFYQEYNRIKPYIDYASKWSDEDENTMVSELLNRKLILITNENAFAFVSILEDQTCFYRHCGGARGSMQGIMDAMAVVEDFAIKNNCKRMMSIGRKGWTKFMTKYGFTVEPYKNQFKYTKEL